MNIILKREQEQDHRAVETVIREAFWNHHGPGCDEHCLAHLLRSSPDFVPELDYVAVDGDRVVGNIMYTLAHVLGDDGAKHPVLCFGPLSVLPEYQGRGIGSRLIAHTRELARQLGHGAILIFGDPEFYGRVGFTGAEDYGIGTSWGTYAAALQACELIPGALKGCGGRFFESEAYRISQEEAEAFDRGFPPKEKLSGLPSQQRFAQVVAMNRPIA